MAESINGLQGYLDLGYPNPNNLTSADLQKFISGGLPALTNGGLSSQVGAQAQPYVNALVSGLSSLADQQYQAKAKELQAVDPYFKIENYVDPTETIFNAGGGASANRSAPLTRLGLKIKSQQNAINLGTEAVNTYKTTGKVTPPPDWSAKAKQKLDSMGGQGRTIASLVYGDGQYIGDEQDRDLAAQYKSIIFGTPISEEVKAGANAAAARVGSPLPYPNSAIAEPAPGGIFTSAAQAQQAYTGGQLNAIGQNIASSNSAGNTQGGINQVTKNADGTLTWNGQTFKTEQEAVNAAQAAGVGSLRFPTGEVSTTGQAGTTVNSTTGISGSTTGGTGSTTGSTSGDTTGVIDTEAQARAQAVLNKYLNDGTIDSGTYQFFKSAVDVWDPAQQVDFANILNTFETIKNSDINPYFTEQANLFISDLETNRKYLEDTNALQKTQTTQDLQKLKETTQKNLASSGQLFTSEGVKQLGEQSVYAVEGTPQAAASPLPTIPAFAGQSGELQKQKTAAVSANDLRYQKSLQDLQHQAEATLGTEKATGLVSGTTMTGGITGSLEEQKKSAQASALTNLYNQQQENIDAKKPTNVLTS